MFHQKPIPRVCGWKKHGVFQVYGALEVEWGSPKKLISCWIFIKIFQHVFHYTSWLFSHVS